MHSKIIIAAHCRHCIRMRRFASKFSRSLDPTRLVDVAEFEPEKIRNFSIIAHVDHGKSTLADRLLELTGVVESDRDNRQLLDKLQVERERGITVKAQTCSMFYRDRHMLNLIDTPGHVDFRFEVSRSLSACNGVLLVVAANEGIQAQTVANFWLAFENNLTIVPIINKIDMRNAEVEKVADQLHDTFDIDKADILHISAKTGLNVPRVLDAIVERIPHPAASSRTNPFRALIFDSWFQSYRGSIACVMVSDGSISKGQTIRSYHDEREYTVAEVGIMHPEMTPCNALYAGQVGYVIANMKSLIEAAVGETLYDATTQRTCVQPFAGFIRIKPTVYSGLFPVDPADYNDLKLALERLCLNDSSVVVQPDSSMVLGNGWRIGFLGVLHMEVFGQRLDQEYDASVVMTAPSVEYRAVIKNNESIRKKRYEGKSEITIVDASKFPNLIDIDYFLEPMIKVTIVVPSEHISRVMALCSAYRGEEGDISQLDTSRTIIKYRMPLADVVTNFFDQLMMLTSGYATFDYEPDEYRRTDLIKVIVRINDRAIDEFSLIAPARLAVPRAKAIVQRLCELIPRQQYEVDIKATVGDSNRTVASKRIEPLRKDFTQLMKGNFGDATRLNKKLSHQAKSKKAMKMVGRVQIPKETFINVLKRNNNNNSDAS